MTKLLSKMRAYGAYTALVGLIVVLIADTVSPEVTLTNRNLQVWILIVGSLYGLDIVVERRQLILEALTGALQGMQNEEGERDG